jgi:hypothetical protein
MERTDEQGNADTESEIGDTDAAELTPSEPENSPQDGTDEDNGK